MSLDAGFDYSPYLGGALSPVQCAALVGRGLTRPCIAIDSSDATLATYQNLVAAGVNPQSGSEAYRELALSNPLGIDAAVADSLQGFKRCAGSGIYIRTLWLTAEDTGAVSSVLEQSLQRAIDLLAGFRIGVYTGWWYEQEFPAVIAIARNAGIPIWWITSEGYNGVAAVPPGYAAIQYAGNVELDGANVDLDMWVV